MPKAKAEIEVTASSQRLAADLASINERFQSWAASTSRAADRQFGRIGKDLGKNLSKNISAGGVAIGNFAGNLITKGFDKIVDAAHGVQDFEHEMLYLQIATKKSQAEMVGLRDEFRKIASETGVSSVAIAKAARMYFDLTSDADGVSEAMSQFAVIAKATDSSLDDVTAAASALHLNLGILPSQMKEVFGAFVEEGNLGKVGIRNVAAEFVSLLPLFKRFGVVGKEGAIEMNAAFQVVADDFGTAGEAATGLMRLMEMLVARQRQLGAAGVKVFDIDDKGLPKMRQFDTIIDDIRKKIPDIRKYHDIFGERQEGRRALDALIAAPQKLHDIAEAGRNAGDAIDRDFGIVAQSGIGRLDIALERAKERLASIFTPERIDLFADALERVVGTVSGALDKIEDTWERITGKALPDNPYAGAPEAPRPGVMDAYISPVLAAKKYGEARMAESAHDTAGRIGIGGGTAEAKRLANAKGYAQGKEAIEGTASHTERVKAAARFADAQPGTPGWEGRHDVGQAYIDNHHIGVAELTAARAANTKDAQEQLLREAVGLLTKIANTPSGAPAPIVKIGDDQVAQSASKAKGARGGWGE